MASDEPKTKKDWCSFTSTSQYLPRNYRFNHEWWGSLLVFGSFIVPKRQKHHLWLHHEPMRGSAPPSHPSWPVCASWALNHKPSHLTATFRNVTALKKHTSTVTERWWRRRGWSNTSMKRKESVSFDLKGSSLPQQQIQSTRSSPQDVSQKRAEFISANLR